MLFCMSRRYPRWFLLKQRSWMEVIWISSFSCVSCLDQIFFCIFLSWVAVSPCFKVITSPAVVSPFSCLSCTISIRPLGHIHLAHLHASRPSKSNINTVIIEQHYVYNPGYNYLLNLSGQTKLDCWMLYEKVHFSWLTVSENDLKI